jgi:hypothetical protein
LHKIFKHTVVKGESSNEVVAKPKSDSGYTVSPPKVSAPVVEEEILGKFDLDGITKNTVTIGGSEVIFTLDKNALIPSELPLSTVLHPLT